MAAQAAQLTQVLGLAQQASQAALREKAAAAAERARATAALEQLTEMATEATEAKEQVAEWATALADLTVQSTQAKELAAAQLATAHSQATEMATALGTSHELATALLRAQLETAQSQVLELATAQSQVAKQAEQAAKQAEQFGQAAQLATALAEREERVAARAATVEARAASQEAHVSALEAQLETAQRALGVMNRAQRGVDRLGLSVPQPPPGLVPTPGWSRCVAALEAVDAGYAKWAGKEQKTLLISNYDDLQPAAQTVECKRRVNGAIGAHLRRLRPSLGAELRDDESLVLLLLEAPGCGTTRALVQALPELGSTGHKICVPQADPTHYATMVHPTPLINYEDTSPLGDDGSLGGNDIGLGLNVRCQRLDVWLCANAARGLKVACFFADFESSAYGRPKVGFAPLRDLQRFLRHRYADEAGCLLGVTLGFRDPHDSRYDAEAPRLGLADLQAFVACEAQAVGLRCSVLETIAYGLTFCLFELVRDDAG